MGRESPRVIRRGVVSELLLFCRILFSLSRARVFSVWSTGWGHMGFSGSAKISIGAFLMLPDARENCCSNQYSKLDSHLVQNCLFIRADPKPRFDLANPWRLPTYLSCEHKHLKALFLQTLVKQGIQNPKSYLELEKPRKQFKTPA